MRQPAPAGTVTPTRAAPAPAPAPSPSFPSTTTPQRPPTNTLAVVALVLGITTSIGGIICGHIALSQIRRTGESGRGMAIAGLLLGYLWLAVLIAYFIFIAWLLNSIGQAANDYEYSLGLLAAMPPLA